MPKKVQKRVPGRWATEHALEILRSKDELWAKKKKNGSCPSGFWETPKAYSSIHPAKTHCVKNCESWKPKRKKDKGQCVRSKTKWMIYLDKFYTKKKAENSDYQYSTAMKEASASAEWQKIKKSK